MTEASFARPGDEAQLVRLYRSAFPDGADFWHWFLKSGPYRPENTLVRREAGQIVSSLQMLPVRLDIDGEVWDAHYIYAAATLPEWRGKGLMGHLLEQAAEEGRLRGQQFSVLIVEEPGLLDYYARFQYRPQIAWGLCPAGTALPEANEHCRRIQPRDIPAINDIYEAAARAVPHGIRNREHWEKQLELYAENAQLLEKSGRVTAYCFTDENGITEVCGPGGERLAAKLRPGESLRTPVMQGQTVISGSIRPLNGTADALLGDRFVYLNLMYN